MSEPLEEDAEPAGVELQLHMAARIIGGLLGLGALGLGFLAVFRSDNQAGTVAMIAIGGLLCLLALVGRIPERGGVGNTNWEYRPFRRLLKSDNPEVQRAAAEAILADPPSSSRSADDPQAALYRAANVVTRRSETMRNLRLIIASALPEAEVETQARVQDRPDRPPLHRADYLVRGVGWHFPTLVVMRAHEKVCFRAAQTATAFGARVCVVVEMAPRTSDIPLREYREIKGVQVIRVHIDSPDCVIAEVLVQAREISRKGLGEPPDTPEANPRFPL